MIPQSFRLHTAFYSALFFAMIHLACRAAEPVVTQPLVPTLTGTWSGTWIDGRASYGGSGGDFTCIAVEVKPNVWKAAFSLGKSKTFNVEISGTKVGSEILFDTTADLGTFHGIYTLKGKITAEGFSATYSGKDEQGTFSMKRREEIKK
ncbi:MAG: hypothetical protein WCT04_09380 [Planctomycetota bacterium]